MSLKKIIVILIIVLGLAISALVVYNLFIKKADQSGSETEQPNGESAVPSQIKAISQEPVLSPIISQNKVRYYSKNNGYVFESNFDGTGLVQTSSAILPNLVKALWSVNQDKVITIFNENNLPRKYFYDYASKISTLLKKEIRWVAWSPQEDKIAYQYYDSQTEDNNISLANPDGSQWQNILKTRMQDLIVEWPVAETISLRTRPSGLSQSVIYALNPANSDLKKIKENYGLSVLWSPLADKILFSETDNYGKKLKLQILDLKKSSVQQLDFATLPEKCVWSKDNRHLFCAVPKTIPDKAVLPDDYYKEAIAFDDEFWQINLETKQAVKITAGDSNNQAYNASELLLAPQEDYLLFINLADGWLYSLKL